MFSFGFLPRIWTVSLFGLGLLALASSSGTLSEAGRPVERTPQKQKRWRPDRSNLAREGGQRTEAPVKAALAWILEHQNKDGYWGGASYVEECKAHGGGLCDGTYKGSEGGVGFASHDVGLTGLCVLALSAADTNLSAGEFLEPVTKAASWLVSRQQSSGLIGADLSHDFLYDHMIATYALCEILRGVEDQEEYRAKTQKAIDYLLEARSPYSGWRYDVPPIGDADTSITAWAMTALVSATVAGFEVPTEALDGGTNWVENSMGEERIGYDGPNTVSGRTPANEHFERSIGEAMTAAGLWCTALRGKDMGAEKLEKYIALLLEVPPIRATEGFGNDLYYWYYGTYAMFQVGGREWKTWNRAMKGAIMPAQHKKGPVKGSWDPVGPWSYVGGRVYATALSALTLQVYYRYPRFRN